MAIYSRVLSEGLFRCIRSVVILLMLSCTCVHAATLSGTVADYNAAKVGTAGGALTVPANVSRYTATSTIAIATQLVITLPPGFQFTSLPVMTSSAAGVTFTHTAGGIGSQSVTYTTGGNPITATSTVSFNGNFTVSGAGALQTVTPVAQALPMTWQFIGVDASPVSRGAFASDSGITFVFVGAIQYIDLTASGTQWWHNLNTIVSSAIAISPQSTDAATASVPILNPNGSANTVSNADLALVTLSGVFQGVGSAFSSSTADCLSPIRNAQSVSPNSISILTELNVEVFYCFNASGQPIAASDPSGTAGSEEYTGVSVNPGPSTDFVSFVGSEPNNIEFGGYTCGSLDGNTCVSWTPPSNTTQVPTLNFWGVLSTIMGVLSLAWLAKRRC